MGTTNIDLSMVDGLTRLHGYLLNIAIFDKCGNKARAHENRLLAKIAIARLAQRGLISADAGARYLRLTVQPCFTTAKRLYLGRGFGSYGLDGRKVIIPTKSQNQL